MWCIFQRSTLHLNLIRRSYVRTTSMLDDSRGLRSARMAMQWQVES